MKPKAIDLFAGAGGLSLGLRWAGFKPVWAVELDPDTANSYSRNHRQAKLAVGDIRKMSCAALMRDLGLRKGQLDMLAGCPPCQGFSNLRTNNGRHSNHDSRNDLVAEVARLVRGLRPKAVMLENVPRLVDDHRFSGLVTELAANGYEVIQRVVDAQNYGVAQRRKRLVMLASRVGTVTMPTGTPSVVTVRDAIGHLPKPVNSSDALHNVAENRRPSVKSLISRIPVDGGSRADVSDHLLDCHRRIQGFHDVYGRMSWDAVAPTLTSGCLNPSKGRFLHPEQDRAITPREAALIQSFPEDYWFCSRRGKEHLALQIGNAFPPAMISNIAKPENFSL